MELGGPAGLRTRHVDGVRLGVLADVGIFARTLRGSEGRQLFPGVCASASRASLPVCFALALGVVAAAFCFLRLKDAIAALVVIRIIVQFLVQAAGLIVLRIRQPKMPRPFRMWLYPLPALLACGGFLFILFNRTNWQKEVRYAAVILLTGLLIYMIRAWRSREWPFTAPTIPVVSASASQMRKAKQGVRHQEHRGLYQERGS